MKFLLREGRKMCMIIHFSGHVKFSIHTLKFYSINVEWHIFQLCLLGNSLSYNHCMLECILLMLTAPLLPARRLGEGPAGRAKRVVSFIQRMSVPPPSQFKTDPGKHNVTSIGDKRGHQLKGHFGIVEKWSQKPSKELHHPQRTAWHIHPHRGDGATTLVVSTQGKRLLPSFYCSLVLKIGGSRQSEHG